MQACESPSVSRGRVVVWLVSALLVPLTVSAQDDSPVNPLASASSLRCRFVLTASAAWKDGRPAAQVEPQEFEVVVSDIDIQGGTADVRSAGGRRFATAMLSAGSLYILQVDRGELNLTSVFATEAFQKRLKASHTRQSFVYLTVPPYNAAPVVTQSYGDCDLVGLSPK